LYNDLEIFFKILSDWEHDKVCPRHERVLSVNFGEILISDNHHKYCKCYPVSLLIVFHVSTVTLKFPCFVLQTFVFRTSWITFVSPIVRPSVCGH
jgi:hypothetical protein